MKSRSYAGIMLILATLCVHAEPVPTLPEIGHGYRITGRLNQVGGKLHVFVGAGQSGLRLTLTCIDLPELSQHWGLTKVPAETSLPDAAIQVEIVSQGYAWAPKRYRQTLFVRPDVHFYVGEDFSQAVDGWSTLPAASQEPIDLQARRVADGLEWWLNGRFLTRIPVEPEWQRLEPSAEAGATVTEAAPMASPERLLLPINLASYPYAGDATMATAVSLPVDPAVFPQPLAGSADVGLSRWLRQALDSNSFYDPYYKRSPFDGVPESLIFRVPKRFYTRAHVVCAVEPGRSPMMTVRIGRYRQSWDGSGLSMGDVDVSLDPTSPENVEELRQIGTISLTRDGEQVQAPVYSAVIQLATGDIADYLQWQGLDDTHTDWGAPLDWLDLEFSRRLETRVTVSSGIFDCKPLGPESGIHLLGLTLESAPVDVMVRSPQPGFVMATDQQPALNIETRNPGLKEVPLALTATFTDMDGKAQVLRQAVVAKPGDVSTALSLTELGPGWYRAELRFMQANGALAWQQSLTLAILPPDTRQAGPESPYGVWWFSGSHYTEPFAERMLPLVKALGFRHISPSHPGKRDALYGRTPEVYSRYGVTPSMCPTMRGKDWPSREQALREFFALWPDTRYAMIFHETSIPDLGIDLPAQLLGKPAPALTEKQQARFTELKDFATQYASLVRQIAPKTQIMLGNGSTQFQTLWLNQRLSREVFDCLGMEMAVQTMHPEGQPTGWNLQSYWLARQMADANGYKDLPIASCYELDYRATGPGGLTLRRQADWYARDVLHQLAYRVPSINVALLADANSSYYTSRWGSTGLCFRSPLNQPKPSFVALATLTRELDGAVYQRWLDLGSTSAYCLEFRHGDHWVYALWSGRGERPAQLTLADAKPRLVDSMGRQLPIDPVAGGLRLTLTESPLYLTSASAIQAMQLGAPRHPDPTLAAATIVAPMRDPAKWKVIETPDQDFQDYCAYLPLAPAPMRLTQGETGLRLDLIPQPDLPDLVGRYTILEPADGPIPIPDKPDTLGLWVDGQADWGRIYLEVEDAAGRRWTSNGWMEAPHSWDMSDWEAETSVNHDGWRFLSFPLPLHYASGYYQPTFRHWRCQGTNAKDNRLAYPIKLSRIYVVKREKLVYLTDLVPAVGLGLGLRDFTAGNR